MKKLVSVLVALMLCLTAVAMAESVPSKTTDDMTNISVSAENMPADSSMVVATSEKDEEHLAACEKEIKKLQESASVAAYFGEVKNAAGEVVSLTEVLGTDALNVFEFTTLTVENFKEEYGKVTANIQFATSYTPGEKVLVMIGLITVAEDGAQNVAWTVFEGVAADDGSINVVLDPATMTSIQNGTAVMAVISK